MKKLIILFVLILSTFHLYAESVNIKFFLQTGEILEKEINANTRLLQINDNFFPESKLYDDFLIVDIEGFIISRKSGQKIQKIANLQYYKSKANYGTKKKGISR